MPRPTTRRRKAGRQPICAHDVVCLLLQPTVVFDAPVALAVAPSAMVSSHRLTRLTTGPLDHAITDDESLQHYRPVADTQFSQQELPGHHLILTPNKVRSWLCFK